MAKQLAFNMDCMTAMRQMPDKAFDLAIVDPPYGINITNSHSVQVERERERERENRNRGRWPIRRKEEH